TALLKLCGAQVVLRLGIDPSRQPPGTVQRDVTVDRSSQATGHEEVRGTLPIGWSGLPDFSEDYCAQVSRALNANDITEKAAIGVMALLIHEMEGVEILHVLPIGSGG